MKHAAAAGNRRCRWTRWVVGTCAVVLVVGWLLRCWPGESFWLSAALTYAPTPVWLVPLFPALIAGAFGRNRRTAFISTGLLLFVLFPLMGFQISLPARPQGGERITIATWNVRNKPASAATVEAELKRLNPDLVFLQEAGSKIWQDDILKDWQKGGTTSQWIRTRGQIEDTHALKLGDSWRPAVAAQTSVGSRSVRLLNVHLSVADPGRSFHRARRNLSTAYAYLHDTDQTRREQIEDIAAWAKEESGPFIVAGDFNTPPHATVWSGLRPLATNTFGARGLGFGYTFHSRLPLWRIDHIWVSRHWRVLRCGTFGDQASDHRGVWAELELR